MAIEPPKAYPATALPSVNDLQTALVHDWLTVYGGAERVLEQLLTMLPASDVFAPLSLLEESEATFLGERTVNTSFLQKFPFLEWAYQKYLPLLPFAIENFDLSSYNLVVSSSFVLAKSVLTTSEQLHVCYSHSPARYMHDLHFEYLDCEGYRKGLKRKMAQALLHYLRLYDTGTPNRVDLFVANSQAVARRIWRAYRRRAVVVYPPVDTERFTLSADKDDYYVTVSRLMPYKHVDVLVQAFNAMPDRHLVVIGAGSELERLRAMAAPNVDVRGREPDEVVTRYVRHARAFLFAAFEDFGIAPLEAQASGTPVLAYGRGGALETVVDGVTGRFFPSQKPEAVIRAVNAFEKEADRFEPEAIKLHADRFSIERFHHRMEAVVDQAWSAFYKSGYFSDELHTSPGGDGCSSRLGICEEVV